MTGRRLNANTNPRGNFGSSNKKSGMQNRNRASGGKSNNFCGGLMNQVSPWLSQSSNTGNSYNSLGRNLVNDPQAQLALASNLLNNLLAPSSQINKLAQPPSLLSLGSMGNSSSSGFSGSNSYSRDRFGGIRSNTGKIQKREDFKKDFGKNKRFGNDRKNFGSKKPDQSNKKVTDEKNAEKKDIDIKEENKVENTDVNQSVSETNVDKTEGDDQTETNENKDESKKSVAEEIKVNYSDIPPALLFCHICRKHMWDDASFEKHLEGRPHKMMVEELDQSYKLKVELLRHEMRVMEQQRENDIQRAQRKGKSNVKMQQRGFCTMCNLSFLGMLPAHRKNERHQRLKKFLHPKCNACQKEFYTRLEWDDHKLTPSHLKKLAEIRKETRPDLEDTEFDITDFIEDINDEIEAEGIDIKVSGKRETLDELKGDQADGTVNEGEENDKEENEKDDKGEDDDENKKLPKYSPGIPVGENFVMEKSGFLCRACNRFILSQEDNKIHCQTITHYNNIIKILKAQNKIVHKRRLNDVKAEDIEKENEVDDSVDESSAKRRKLEDSTAAVMNGTPVKEENSGKGTEKYDPEDPDSEPEKENDMEEKEPAQVKECKITIEEVKQETKMEETVSEQPKEDKKTTKSPVGRPPRARRGRRT